MITFWFDTHMGIKIFNKMGTLYHNRYGAYPTTLVELPKFINDLGYEVFPVHAEPPSTKYEKCGLTMEDHVATALILTLL